jgi:hypothetical protein
MTLLHQLPDNVIVRILNYLPLFNILNCRILCKHFNLLIYGTIVPIKCKVIGLNESSLELLINTWNELLPMYIDFRKRKYNAKVFQNTDLSSHLIHLYYDHSIVTSIRKLLRRYHIQIRKSFLVMQHQRKRRLKNGQMML